MKDYYIKAHRTATRQLIKALTGSSLHSKLLKFKSNNTGYIVSYNNTKILQIIKTKNKFVFKPLIICYYNQQHSKRLYCYPTQKLKSYISEVITDEGYKIADLERATKANQWEARQNF